MPKTKTKEKRPAPQTINQSSTKKPRANYTDPTIKSTILGAIEKYGTNWETIVKDPEVAKLGPCYHESSIKNFWDRHVKLQQNVDPLSNNGIRQQKRQRFIEVFGNLEDNSKNDVEESEQILEEPEESEHVLEERSNPTQNIVEKEDSIVITEEELKELSSPHKTSQTPTKSRSLLQNKV